MLQWCCGHDATRIERHGATPGDDYAISQRIDQWLYRVNEYILISLVTYHVLEAQWHQWQLIACACYAPYLCFGLKPSTLLFYQIILAMYIGVVWAREGVAGVFGCALYAQISLTMGVMLWKRFWHGLDVQHL